MPIVRTVWRELNGRVDLASLLGDRAEDADLVLPGNDLVVGATYNFSVTGTLEGQDTASSSAIAMVHVVARDLVCIVAGGDRTISDLEPLVLDGAASHDPEVDGRTGDLFFTWECRNTTATITTAAAAAGVPCSSLGV